MMYCSAGSKFIRVKPPWQGQTFATGSYVSMGRMGGLLQFFQHEEGLVEKENEVS